MKILGSYEKQPDEFIPSGRWGVDFDPDIISGEAISSATIVVYDKDGTDVTSTLTSGSLTISGTTVSIAYTGGTAGEVYHAEHKVVTDASGIYEAEVRIYVFDPP